MLPSPQWHGWVYTWHLQELNLKRHLSLYGYMHTEPEPWTLLWFEANSFQWNISLIMHTLYEFKSSQPQVLWKHRLRKSHSSVNCGDISQKTLVHIVYLLLFSLLYQSCQKMIYLCKAGSLGQLKLKMSELIYVYTC